MRLLKQDVCPDCGRITNERYRQMKALNRRRWEQIQELETANARLQTELEIWRARVAREQELTEEFRAERDRQLVENSQHIDRINDTEDSNYILQQRVGFLKTEADRLRAALEFYAEPFTWARVAADARHMGALGDFDYGAMYGQPARAALKGNADE